MSILALLCTGFLLLIGMAVGMLFVTWLVVRIIIEALEQHQEKRKNDE